MRFRRSLICLCCVWLCGCGTLVNLRGTGPYSPNSPISGLPPAMTVYGGFALSAAGGTLVIVDGINTDLTEVLPGLYLLAVDAPLSAVADTLTLPITIPATIDKLRHASDKKPELPNAYVGPASREPPRSEE